MGHAAKGDRRKESVPPAAKELNPKSARRAGLLYVAGFGPGLRRLPSGKGFSYRKPSGRKVSERATLERIRKLVIPPAWREVWICPNPRGHIQATGRDARGRKQYIYHPRWREVRDDAKYNRLVAFGRVLPVIRRRVRRDLRTRGLGRAKILAAVVRLLDMSAIRIGNEEYAEENKSYGLTTLKNRHVRVKGTTIQLKFRGKAGKEHCISIDHPRLARIVRRCQELPGQDLFQYMDEEGRVVDVTSGDVNDYLFEISGQNFTSKDFRTWTGTVLAAVALQEMERLSPKGKPQGNILRAIKRVAERLGNTPSVCRKCYIHPIIFDSYLDGTLVDVLRKEAERQMKQSLARLRPEEAAVLAILHQRLKSGGPSLLELLRRSGQGTGGAKRSTTAPVRLVPPSGRKKNKTAMTR